jgi:cytochrome P450
MFALPWPTSRSCRFSQRRSRNLFDLYLQAYLLRVSFHNVLAGREIPGGTIVGMAILHVHQSEEVFTNPLAFKPERWLEEGSKGLDHWLVPFSRGLRACLGYNLAWCELYVAFSTIIRTFDISLDGTTPEDMEWRECITAYYPNRYLHAWCEPVEK